MSFFERVGRWALGNRAIILVVMGLLTCLALVQARLLRFDFQPSAMMQVSEEESAFADEVAARYAASSDDILLMVLHSDERDAVLTQYGLSLLHLVHELADQSGIAVEVQSLSNIPQIPDFIRKKSGDGASGGGLGAIGELFKKPADLLTAFSIPPPLIPSRPASLDDVARVKHRLATSALLPGTLVSADGSTAIVILKLHPRFSDLELLSPALETLEEVTAAALQNPDFAATLGSSPAFEVRYGGPASHPRRDRPQPQARPDQVLAAGGWGVFFVDVGVISQRLAGVIAVGGGGVGDVLDHRTVGNDGPGSQHY